MPPIEKIEHETYTCFADMDASPTKTWLVAHLHDAQWKWHTDLAFAKRPADFAGR